jgi:TonB family protein
MGSDALAVMVGRWLLASGAATLLVLALRRPLRAWLGPRCAYALWACVPLVALAALLPARRVLVPARWASPPPPGELLPLATLPVSAGATPWLLLAWAAGALALLLVLGWRQRRFVRALGPLRAQGGRVFVAEGCAGLPATFGVLRPRIVLPADFDSRYSPAQQRLVLAHERVHLRRGDLWANALALLLLGLHWFNPLALLAWRRFRLDQELACDAVVIASEPGARRAYGAALLKTPATAAAVALACQWTPTHPLKERIAMLKHQGLSTSTLLVARVAVGAACLAIAAAAWAALPTRIVPAAAIDKTPPRYPLQALRQAQSGQVVLLVDVDAQGRVSHVQVERSTPAGVFDDAALAAARGWTFSPRREDGKAAAGRVRVPVWFDSLMQPAAAPADAPTGDFRWYRADLGRRRAQVCDAVAADPEHADGEPLCGIRQLAAR